VAKGDLNPCRATRKSINEIEALRRETLPFDRVRDN